MAAIRYPTQEKASVEIYGRLGHFIADVKNVSETGACLELAEESPELQAGDLLRMTIVLRFLKRRHDLKAQVVWKKGNRTGVNFLKTTQFFEKIIE